MAGLRLAAQWRRDSEFGGHCTTHDRLVARFEPLVCIKRTSAN